MAEPPAEHRLALLKDARFLLSLREELASEEKHLAARRMGLARSYLNDAGPPDEKADSAEVGT